MRYPKRAEAYGTWILIALVSAVGLCSYGETSGRNTWDGIYSSAQAERGQTVYMSDCSSCHGPQLNGIDAAPGLNGGSFYANWNGISLKDMANRIKISMPQNSPGSLSRQQVVDVMAYIFSRNGFPPGEKELPKRPAYMADIVFRSSAN